MACRRVGIGVFASVIVILATTAAGAAGRETSYSRGCANLDRARQDRLMLRQDWLRGDVTGDGKRDTVAIVEDKAATLRCRFGVAVISARAFYVLPLGRSWIWKPGEVIGQPWPLIRSLPEIDSHPGAEILVALTHGASFEQGELLTFRASRLLRLRLPQHTQLDYGAIATTGTNFDCVRRGAGRVVRTHYGYSGINARGSMRFTLETYRVVGLALRRVAIRSATRPMNVAKGVYPRAPGWWSRYDTDLNPFRRCVIAKQGPM